MTNSGTRYMDPGDMCDLIDDMRPVINAAIEWYNKRNDNKLNKSVEEKLAKEIKDYIKYRKIYK